MSLRLQRSRSLRTFTEPIRLVARAVNRVRTDTTTGLSALITRLAAPSASMVTSVPDSASSVTLLASNTVRKGATIYNDSSALLYVKLGATASITSFTAVLAGNGGGTGGYLEVPFGYTGVIDGIWASDAGGNARVTEVA